MCIRARALETSCRMQSNGGRTTVQFTNREPTKRTKIKEYQRDTAHLEENFWDANTIKKGLLLHRFKLEETHYKCAKYVCLYSEQGKVLQAINALNDVNASNDDLRCMQELADSSEHQQWGRPCPALAKAKEKELRGCISIQQRAFQYLAVSFSLFERRPTVLCPSQVVFGPLAALHQNSRTRK